uniref:Thymidylate_kin domain-containing protein n=1 Tax=Gongylonema pulchrum TaxID=637853 RepID=A0A183D4B5_9BILA
LGRFIDRYLKKEVEMDPREAHLVFAANRQGLMSTMKEKLRSGTHLIVDRYAYSGIAYTLAKGDDSITMNWAKLADFGELKPDCVVFLDLPQEKAQRRSGFGDERFETDDFQEKVYGVMKTLAADDKELWKVVDASPSVDEVAECIWKLIEPLLESASRKPFMFIGDK